MSNDNDYGLKCPCCDKVMVVLDWQGSPVEVGDGFTIVTLEDASGAITEQEAEREWMGYYRAANNLLDRVTASDKRSGARVKSMTALGKRLRMIQELKRIRSEVESAEGSDLTEVTSHQKGCAEKCLSQIDGIVEDWEWE